MSLTGTRLGSYDVLDRIGAGGMGETGLLEETSGRPVTVVLNGQAVVKR